MKFGKKKRRQRKKGGVRSILCQGPLCGWRDGEHIPPAEAHSQIARSFLLATARLACNKKHFFVFIFSLAEGGLGGEVWRGDEEGHVLKKNCESKIK